MVESLELPAWIFQRAFVGLRIFFFIHVNEHKCQTIISSLKVFSDHMH